MSERRKVESTTRWNGSLSAGGFRGLHDEKGLTVFNKALALRDGFRERDPGGWNAVAIYGVLGGTIGISTANYT